jgi:hypothetical protein
MKPCPFDETNIQVLKLAEEHYIAGHWSDCIQIPEVL